MKKTLPPDIAEYFRKEGSKGGKKSRAAQTPEQRRKQARKAIKARWAKRKAKP